MKISSARPVRESSHTTPKFQCKCQIEGKNAVRTLRPRVQSAKRCNTIHPSEKKEIQDMDGHREHQLAGGANERERSKQESRMKNARNHPQSNHTVEDELEEVRAALR
jgi:hypothetical protein